MFAGSFDWTSASLVPATTAAPTDGAPAATIMIVQCGLMVVKGAAVEPRKKGCGHQVGPFR